MRSLAFLAFLIASSPAARAAGDECTPSRLMVVLDKSSSMTGTIAGQSKWSIAVGALDAIASGYQNSIQLGLAMFPQPDECSPGSVFVEPALGTRSAMMSSLAAPPPDLGNWTPMAQTLEAMAVEPSLVTPGAPAYAVLITDGWQWCYPYASSTRFAPVDAIASLNAAGITTFVVGFGDSVDALALNYMAVEAGTALAGCDPTGDTPTAANPCYYQADDPAQLLEALQAIALEVSGEVCDGLDNDCDGEVDEDLVRDCATDCGTGTETCVAGTWTGCDAPAPEADVCDGADNDCDGTTDPGCDCAAGETRPCGETETTGACQPGTQTCAPDGTWGACEGSVSPGTEQCDGLDNDCDGATDETDDDVGGLCGPGFECVGGECEEMDPWTPPDTPESDLPGVDDNGAAHGSCGCRAGGTPAQSLGSLALLLGVALVLRRRRR